MKKYKCLDPNCGHTWDLDSDPFECPACNGTNFVEIRKPRWFKYLLTLGGILIAFILLLQLCSDGKTTVKTDANILQCKLTVTIDGDHKTTTKLFYVKVVLCMVITAKKPKPFSMNWKELIRWMFSL